MRRKSAMWWWSTLPRASRSWRLPEPGGRPLPRFPSEEAGEKGEAEPEVGDKARAMPSSPYFLGLPLFFLAKRSPSPPLLPPLPNIPMAKPAPSVGGTVIAMAPTTPLESAGGRDRVGDKGAAEETEYSFASPPPSHPDTTMLSLTSMLLCFLTLTLPFSKGHHRSSAWVGERP
ncbi:hypothetical protein BHE74_00016544 [Ensete ventricosum]|nr:hypothetical protein BHE74_00016544 [Ensete ventricosum]